MKRTPYRKDVRTLDMKRTAALMFLVQCNDKAFTATTPDSLARAHGLSVQEAASLLLQQQLRRSL